MTAPRSASAPPGEARPALSICVFCGSSDDARPAFLQAAAALGRRTAAEGIRLVYGGGGIGLMGAAARAAHAAGGDVLGVMPQVLMRKEVVYDAVRTLVVPDMHARKRAMFDASDAFVVLPGGIGTLEEAVEVLSWRRLDLHRKPVVFLDQEGFWSPFFTLMRHMVDERLAPSWSQDTWAAASAVDDVLPAVRRMIAAAADGPGFLGYASPPDQPACVAPAPEA